ncbi:rhomboid family intramembrane serine protease [Fimbriimonas ginsengisoli]|nr:rhomboid family intramembrane serine protease [Fimbriimonas ginsengisoli]
MSAASCVLCGIIFVALNANSSGGWAATARWGLLPESAIYKGAYWALISSAFVHVQLLHLLFNLSWLWSLGGALERTIGPWRWLLFLLTSAFVSSGLQLALGGMGIGMSGVIYAMFGFAWATRRRFPEMAMMATKGNVQIFVGWGVLCIFLTYTHLMNIGNGAHFGGLLFGLAVGALVDHPKLRIPASLGLVVLTAGAIVPLYWNPLSPLWAAWKADGAFQRNDVPEAIRFTRMYLDRGGDDQEWAWRNLAIVYAHQKDRAHFQEAIDHLKAVNRNEAESLAGDYDALGASSP